MECHVSFAETVIISFNKLVLSEVGNNLVKVDRIFIFAVNQFHTEIPPLFVGTSYDIVERPRIGGFEKLPATLFGFHIESHRNKVENPHI